MIFQVIALIFIAFALSRVVRSYGARTIARHEFLLWMLFWSIVAVAVSWPNALSRLAALVRIGRGVDLATYSALALIFFLLFRIFVRIDRIERDITLMTRKDALKAGKK